MEKIRVRLPAGYLCGRRAGIVFGEPGPGGGKHLRVLPHITHTGEFHLERLTQLLKSRYGKSFAVPTDTTSSDRALKDVISFAARIQDQDIQRELLLFYLNCSPPVIQEYLRSETPLGQGGPFWASKYAP